MLLLTLTDLQVRYGQIFGTHGLSFELGERETLALVGANGAGKSSTLRAIVGIVKYDGDVLWQGRSLKRIKTSKIVRLGIGFSPEGRRVFPQFSVYENLKIGAYSRPEGFEERVEQMFTYFPQLRERSRQRDSSLS